MHDDSTAICLCCGRRARSQRFVRASTVRRQAEQRRPGPSRHLKRHPTRCHAGGCQRGRRSCQRGHPAGRPHPLLQGGKGCGIVVVDGADSWCRMGLQAPLVCVGFAGLRARILSSSDGGPFPGAQVPFMAVPDLVGARRVLLRGGVAYVAQEQVRRPRGRPLPPTPPGPFRGRSACARVPNRGWHLYQCHTPCPRPDEAAKWPVKPSPALVKPARPPKRRRCTPWSSAPSAPTSAPPSPSWRSAGARLSPPRAAASRRSWSRCPRGARLLCRFVALLPLSHRRVIRSPTHSPQPRRPAPPRPAAPCVAGASAAARARSCPAARSPPRRSTRSRRRAACRRAWR